MELEIVIDKTKKEKVVVYAHEKNETVCEIEKLITSSAELFGFKKDEAVKLNINEVVCFVTEEGKVFAFTEKEKLRLKLRLYQIEEMLNDSFIKINQSCIANIKKISRFKATIGGALNVSFTNGYCDYVSRRNLKNVKERLGL